MPLLPCKGMGWKDSNAVDKLLGSSPAECGFGGDELTESAY
jgi:hypothetical protein